MEEKTVQARAPGKTIYMKVSEAASTLGMSPLTIYRMMREGKIPSLRLGRHWRIPRVSFESMLRKKTKMAKQ